MDEGGSLNYVFGYKIAIPIYSLQILRGSGNRFTLALSHRFRLISILCDPRSRACWLVAIGLQLRILLVSGGHFAFPQLWVFWWRGWSPFASGRWGVPIFDTAGEIGRASCRARVEVAVGGGAVW